MLNHITRFWFTPILFLAIFGCPMAAGAQEKTFQEITTESDAIVLGTVIDINGFLDPNDGIVSDVTIQPDLILTSNEHSPFITIRVLGGVAGNIWRTASHTPRFEKHKTVLLFLKKREQDYFYTVAGGAQGKHTLVADRFIEFNLDAHSFLNEGIRILTFELRNTRII